MTKDVNEIAEKLTTRIDRIKTDCGSAVYTSVLRDRVVDLANVVDVLVKAFAGEEVDLSPVDNDLIDYQQLINKRPVMEAEKGAPNE